MNRPVHFSNGHYPRTAVACYHCGHSCTHQSKVEVYNAVSPVEEPDDCTNPKYSKTVVWDNGSTMTQLSSSWFIENPSQRRQGVRIHLTCEECDKLFYLEVVQHKGATLVHMNEECSIYE